MTALSCQPCGGHAWPARNAGCECLIPCGAEACTGSATPICLPEPVAVETVTRHRPLSAKLPPDTGRLSLASAASLAKIPTADLARLSENGLAPARRGPLRQFDRDELNAWVAGWAR